MVQILPWSPSSLDTFINCGRQYHGKYVEKRYPPEEKSEEQDYGSRVHLDFELRQANKKELPDDLLMHEEFMQRLEALPGEFFTEQKIALTKALVPVSWDWRKEEIWYRGVIDYKKVDGESKRAWIVDYKTGKPHQKFKQLVSYALHTFISHPIIDLIDVRFYWTRDGTNTRKVWGRADIDMLWGMLLPDLQQYKQAFKTDTWQERPSGLCNGWCPDTLCKHWKPKRNR